MSVDMRLTDAWPAACAEPWADVVLPRQRAQQTAKVLIADHADITAEGLRAVLDLKAAVRVVGRASTLGEAEALLRTLRPEVLLLDAELAPQGVLAAAQSWQARERQLKIVLLLTVPDRDLLRRAFAARVAGLLLKSSSASTVERALGALLAGRSFLDDRLRPFVDELTLDARRPACPVLSRAELRVLRVLTQGLSDQAIARVLGISKHTVKSHVSSTLRKLDCRDRTHAVAFAIQHGLV